MGESKISEAAAALKTWKDCAQEIALRQPPHAVQEHFALPSALTPDDCIAAGFIFYEEGCARYEAADGVFQVNFVPSLTHYTALFYATSVAHVALLWVDGRQVPFPLDGKGRPAVEPLTRWLDGCFSKGFLDEVDCPARVLFLWAWNSQVGRQITQGKHTFTQDYPPPPQGLKPADCAALGFEFFDDLSAYNFLDDAGKSTVRIEFSPNTQHQALLIQGPDWSGALLWVDGEIVPVPRNADGDPMCKQSAEWLDNRFLYVETGGLWNHPLVARGVFDILGNVHGLLVWDAVKRVRHLHLPESTQAWTRPVIKSHGTFWYIYPDLDAFRTGHPDRIVTIPA